MLGLALGVGLVIAISSLSRGLDHAQKTALDPLASIGTDLTVTLSPQQDTGFGGPGGGFGGGGQILQANQSALTDLSRLGKPGTKFVHDFLLPGTQLTFPQSQVKQLASIGGVAAVSDGLMLSGVHQQGTVPKIVARFRTGGQRLRVTGQVRFQQSPAERAKIQACFQKYARTSGGNTTTTTPNGQGAAGQLGGARGAGGAAGSGGGFGGGRRVFFDSAAARKCLPAQIRNYARTIVTPEQTVQQLIDPPQTNIKSSTYSIAGVDPSRPGIGLVTPALVTTGKFFAPTATNQALLSETYAAREKLKLGAKLHLNGTTFTVVGLVRPPLGGQTADVYVPLKTLQTLAGQKGAVNVALVRAASSSSVAGVQQAIETAYPNAQVASSKQVADQISGSLVDASNLSHRLGVALAIIAALAAFLLAALLTLSSVGKRTRELGTLKALGWTQGKVVRQVVGESLTQGVLGGLLGVLLGVAIAAGIGAFGQKLDATSTTGGDSSAFFGLGAISARAVTDQVSLTAPLAAEVLLAGFLLAVLGGLVAGTAGAFRAARLRPADALRTVE
jgi:ABC-type antimicrobial peptide transport system permease subunit